MAVPNNALSPGDKIELVKPIRSADDKIVIAAPLVGTVLSASGTHALVETEVGHSTRFSISHDHLRKI